MEESRRQLPAEVLLEEYRVLLRDPEIEALPLVITGSSMVPFLVHERDTVYLSRLQRPAGRGDILLYQRDTGDYILHRVCRVQNGLLTMIGDNQTVREPGIRPEQVMAVVTAVVRKGKRLEPDSFLWRLFAGPWLAVIPIRRQLLRLYTALRRPGR